MTEAAAAAMYAMEAAEAVEAAEAAAGNAAETADAAEADHWATARDRAATALNVPAPFVIIQSTSLVFQALISRPAGRIKYRSGDDGDYVRRLPAAYTSGLDLFSLFDHFIESDSSESVSHVGLERSQNGGNFFVPAIF